WEFPETSPGMPAVDRSPARWQSGPMDDGSRLVGAEFGLRWQAQRDTALASVVRQGARTALFACFSPNASFSRTRLSALLFSAVAFAVLGFVSTAFMAAARGAPASGGSGSAPPRIASALLQAAKEEPNPEVRAQLAATARRLPASQGLPIVAA